MCSYEDIEDQFRFLGADFLKEFKECCVIQQFEAKTELMYEGQNIKFIPVVLTGLVKVFAMNEDRELVYYFVRPKQSCIMTFSAAFRDGISRVSAVTEDPTEVLLIPVYKVLRWMNLYPALNRFFYNEYDLRFAEMIDMLNKVVFHRLDRRVMDYLHQKVEITGKNPVKVSHKDIANSLGTAREVVSRILKKFEHEGNIRQNSLGIEVMVPL